LIPNIHSELRPQRSALKEMRTLEKVPSGLKPNPLVAEKYGLKPVPFS